VHVVNISSDLKRDLRYDFERSLRYDPMRGTEVEFFNLVSRFGLISGNHPLLPRAAQSRAKPLEM
jgi:hypothetical protein